MAELNHQSHADLIKFTVNTLNKLLPADQYLHYLPKDITLEEINNEIALVHGQSMTIVVERADGKAVKVIVPQSGSRVFQLKRAVQRAFNLKMSRGSSKHRKQKKISWKYIWRTYHLSFNGSSLDNDSKLLSDFGLVHKSVVTFIETRRKKNCGND